MPQGDSAPCLRSLFVSALGTFLEFSAWICVELCWSLGPGLVKEDSGASQGGHCGNWGQEEDSVGEVKQSLKQSQQVSLWWDIWGPLMCSPEVMSQTDGTIAS